jgi:hypothetical protein
VIYAPTPFDLLNSNMATAPLLEQLTALFMTSPTLEAKRA